MSEETLDMNKYDSHGNNIMIVEILNMCCSIFMSYRDTTRSTVVIQAKNVQNELMVEIYSKSLFRAIGKVIHIRFS